MPVEIIRANTLDPVDVPLNGPRAPVDGESGLHSQPIAVEIAAEAAQFRWTSGLDISYPLIELGTASLTDKNHESL